MLHVTEPWKPQPTDYRAQAQALQMQCTILWLPLLFLFLSPFLQFSIVHVTLYDRDELINFPLSIHWMKDVGPNKPLAGCWYHLPFPSLLFLINRGIIRQISPVKFVWLQGKIITTLFGGWQVQFTSIESHLSGPGFLLQQVWVLNYNFKC
jgi:hypothetical protein